MEPIAPVLGQLLGLDLDTSTWVAVSAAFVAVISVFVNIWNVSRTLKRSDEQARLRSYSESRDAALAILGPAALNAEDLRARLSARIHVVEQRLGFPDYPVELVERGRDILGSLRGSHFAFAQYAAPDDQTVARIGEITVAYGECISFFGKAWADTGRDPAKWKADFDSAYERFVSAANQLVALGASGARVARSETRGQVGADSVSARL